MMDKPIVAAREPFKVDVQAGKAYYWCACGLSKNQPFCDGSHKGSGFTPQAYKADADKTVWLCGCKQTKNAPLCDGTHKTLQA
jgi:CDGSH iron-sulfur domain-containing protein 3